MLKMLAGAHIDRKIGETPGQAWQGSVPGAELGPELAVAAGYALPVAVVVEDVVAD